MTSDRAVRLIRAHGHDAWPTDDPEVILVMNTYTYRLPGGIAMRAEPFLLAAERRDVMDFLGY